MELTLERTRETAEADGTPVGLWLVRGGDGSQLGAALIAEIIAIPPIDVLTVEQTRHLLAMELDGEKPIIRVQPTSSIVVAHYRTPARIWLGRSGEGLTIGAFIVAIMPQDPDLASLLEADLVRSVLDGRLVPRALLPTEASGRDPAQPLR